MNGVSVSTSNPNPLIVVDAKGSGCGLSDGRLLQGDDDRETTQLPKTTLRSSNRLRTKKRRQQSFMEDTGNMDQHCSDTSPHHDDDDEHHHDSPDDGSPKPKRRKRTRSTHRMPWEERLQQLRDYKAKHGDLLIPIRFKENPSLGKFVHNTREQYKLFQKPPSNSKTKRCSLTAERVRQLEELGFLWSTERTKHQKEDWEARLQQLRDYKAKHGGKFHRLVVLFYAHTYPWKFSTNTNAIFSLIMDLDCLVPHGYPEDPSFAEWVHRQRTTHAHMLKEDERHHHHNPLVEQRMKQLEDLGFHFTVHADKWKEHFDELKRYNEIHGHCQVPTHCPSNPKLGRWVHTQRHQRRLQLKGKKSCMTDERVELLNSLGFSWEVRPLQKPEDESDHEPHGMPNRHTGEELDHGMPNRHPVSAHHHPHHHDIVHGQSNGFEDFLGSAHSDDLHLEGHSVSENSSESPAPQAPDHDCTFHAHPGAQVDLFGHPMTMV
jgi:Helicase associated domain